MHPLTVQSCSAASAGADEEFRLSMELLRPAYGQVRLLSMPTTRVLPCACVMIVLITPMMAMPSRAFAQGLIIFGIELRFVKIHVAHRC